MKDKNSAMIGDGAVEEYDPIPETCEEALKRWDEGASIFTVEMGGLGPGYEQCIHILTFEIVRDQLAAGPLPNFESPEPRHEWSEWGRMAITRTDADVGGYSGAQVGAAKNLAYLCLRDGWRNAVRSVPEDRLIQVRRDWPK